MKFLVKRISSIVKKLRFSTKSPGFVERISFSSLGGWVLDHQGKGVVLALVVGKESYELAPVWITREDVSKKYGQQYLNSGFICEIPHHISTAMKEHLRTGSTLYVTANGKPLSVICSLPNVGDIRKIEPLNILLEAGSSETKNNRHNSSVIEGKIVGCTGFVLFGWLSGVDKIGHNLSLKSKGLDLECDVLEGLDFDDINDVPENAKSFEVILPGYIWEQAEGDEVRVDILLNGDGVTKEPFILSSKKAIQWICEIAAMPECEEKQYSSLLALEHLRYSSLFEGGSALTRSYYIEFIEKMQLGDFFSDVVNGDVEASDVSKPDDVHTLLLWSSLRELNVKMKDDKVPVYEHVKGVLIKNKLKGGVKNNYIKSIIPLLCRRDQFAELRTVTEFSRLHALADTDDSWTMSLSLPALVTDGMIDRAVDVLWRLRQKINQGWLNTECISYSLMHVHSLERSREIDTKTAEKFRYAVIGLFDAFEGEWFSRLHDQSLIDVALFLVETMPFYTDYHRSDVENALVRVYGLNQVFWAGFAEKFPRQESVELSIARGHWDTIYGVLSDKFRTKGELLEKLVAPFNYFAEKNNREVSIYLRELVVDSLSTLNADSNFAALSLAQKLIASNSAEAMRIAAFPNLDNNILHSSFSELMLKLPQTIREMSERPGGGRYKLQIDAARVLRELKEVDDRGYREQANATHDEVATIAIGLSNVQGGFLGVELLVDLILSVEGQEGNVEPWLICLDDVLSSLLSENHADDKLLPSICSALYRLNSLTRITLLHAWLKEIKTTLRDKYKGKYEYLFDVSHEKRLMVAQQGWPHDTLVVIYSCRKYLDTRVAAIRQSWGKDLLARGIPYVVLVGDGDDTLQGDLLALNVADTYEDLPRKTLSMFEWVYKNTDAQYVIKIDDDCYLDVDSYFNSLSYRKHHYYGRVLHRTIGAMDRTWHHDKSHRRHAKLSIDKSPEPSCYADGGGGYCLSRYAIHQLIQAEKDEFGQRLILSSYMEDKLVGDLLNSMNIRPSNEDYECYQRRRTYGDAMPVAMWENTFFPSAVTPTKVVHLDTPDHQSFSAVINQTDELWPKKIWPTCWAPSIKLNSNQLELLTPLEKFHELNDSELYVVSVVRNEMVMLPRFLEHYRQLGVKTFVIVDNCSDDGTREYLYNQIDVILYSSDTEYKYSHYGVAWQQAVLGNLCLNKWVLLVDADELLVYEDSEQKPLSSLVDDLEAGGYNAMRTDMIDMYPYGDLADADFTQDNPFAVANWFDKEPLTLWRLGTGWFSNRPNWSSSLRHRLAPDSEPNAYVSQKYALFRYYPWVRLSQGLHYQSGMNEPKTPAYLAHFKYHAGFKDKVMEEVKRKQHYNDASEYKRYMSMLTEGQGGFGADNISVKYSNSRSFAQNSD